MSIMWLSDSQTTVFRSLADGLMAPVKNDVPEYGKARVLYTALK